MIRAWGGWTLFQELLKVLQTIATKHHVDVSNVAARWVLDQPETGAVIVGEWDPRLDFSITHGLLLVGSRLGVTDHIQSSLKTFDVELSSDDVGLIDSVLAKSKARQLIETIGDCGSEYR